MKEYDKECDIWFKHFGKTTTKHSRELENVNLVVDFDKDDNIVGIEIFDFMEAIHQGQKKIDKIFKTKIQPIKSKTKEDN